MNDRKKQKILKLKKVCIPLENLKKNFTETINENELKEFVSSFDLDGKANFSLFQKFKDYNEYLNKYKYTLFYEDAKKLKCFPEINENNLLNSINKQMLALTKENRNIPKITSLSKIKILNFFLYLLNLKPIFTDFENILKEIKSHEIKINFTFKSPIKLFKGLKVNTPRWKHL